MIEISDSILVNQLKSNNKDAFELLVNRHKDMVFNVCLNFINNEEDAEETTQDVFIEVFNSIISFKFEATLKTWIYRIAITKSLEFNRKSTTKKRFAFMFSLSNIKESELESSKMSHPSVEEEKQEKAKLIFKELKKLSNNQQIAFNLYHIEGMAYLEIAEIMEMSLSSIESLIFRAKKTLRKRLAKTYQHLSTQI